VSVYHNRIHFQQGDFILEIEWIESDKMLICGTHSLATILPKATQLFSGVAIQNLLKSYHVSLFTEARVCHQIRIPEIESYRPIECKLERNVLMIVALDAKTGQYH